MENKAKYENRDEKNRYIETDTIITVYFKRILKSNELKNKYLDLLNQRIDENRKSLNRLLLTMFFLVIVFPLILETKISEITVGPFKLKENSIALLIIPSIFAFYHYKTIQIQLILERQIKYYKGLVSVIFHNGQYSIVNNILKPYTFLDSTRFYHLTEDSKPLINFIKIFWIPIHIGIIFLPYWFVYYTVKTIYSKFGLDNIQEIIFFLVPILISFFTIILKIQYFKREPIDDDLTEEELEKIINEI